jgi:hypothetical protein
MTGIRRWERRRQVGRVLLWTRRDNAGCANVGASIPRRGPGLPHAVIRVDRYDRSLFARVVVFGWEAYVADAWLADAAPFDDDAREFGRVLVRAGRVRDDA